MRDVRRTARRGTTPLLAGLVLALSGCAGMATGQAPEPGTCYFFEQDEAVAALRLPQGVLFTDRALEGWPAIMGRGDVRVAVTLTRDGRADYPFGYWLEEDDGVEVGYPAGGGLVLALTADGAALEGTARSLGDARPMGEDGDRDPVEVRLLPGACPR